MDHYDPGSIFWPDKWTVVSVAKKVPAPSETCGIKDPVALVQTNCRPFYAGFRIIARVHRLSGCCFLENLASIHYKDVRSRRLSRYLLYPLCIWAYLLLVGVAMSVDAQQHNYGLRGADRLNRNIFHTSMLAVNVEAALNSVLLMVRAPQLVELLRITGLIEQQNSMPLYVQIQTVRFAWSLVLFQVSMTVLNIGLNIYSDFGAAVLVEEGRKLTPYMMKLAISFGIIGVSFISILCISTRLLLMYASRTVALYLGCICRSLDRCLRSRSIPKSRKAVLVDHMRVQISLVKNSIALVSAMLGPSLLYAYAYSVALLCAAGYYTIIPELEFRVRLFFFIFGILHWLSILLPAAMVHNMKLAVIELQSTIQAMSNADYSEDLLVQVRMFVDTIRPDDLRVTGCGFFDVDLGHIR
ncbi:hypothetical protein MTO96_032945 [Rhipicephalus appendiculatus]